MKLISKDLSTFNRYRLMKCPKCGSTKIIKEEVSDILNFILGFIIYLPLACIDLSYLSLAFVFGLAFYLCGISFEETRYKCIDCGYTWSQSNKQNH